MARTAASEVFSENLPTRGFEPLDMTAPQAVRALETVSGIPDPMGFSSLADALAFNEEVLEIRLEPRAERNAPSMIDVSVNGDLRWLPIGVPIRIQRKFVEVLARSVTVGITTRHGTAHEDNPPNLIDKHPYRNAPFSVLKDPNPKGPAWLAKIIYER
jgi:hypothetical protein